MICKVCGDIVMASAKLEGSVCPVCLELGDFGTSREQANRLSMMAVAQRAAHPDEPRIRCAEATCSNWAREFWFFCSSDCRDAWVRANP